MKVKFTLDGKECSFDKEKNEIIINGKKISNISLSQTEVARINKALRDVAPKLDYLKLNIGCGHRPFPDMINLDYDKSCYPDVVRDINEGLPFDDNKIDEIYTSHVIEHVKDIFFFMYEIWRVSKNKAIVNIICPNCSFLPYAIQPDHLRFINWSFFERWRPEHISVQTEILQTRGAFFNIKFIELINEERELHFVLEVVK